MGGGYGGQGGPGSQGGYSGDRRAPGGPDLTKMNAPSEPETEYVVKNKYLDPTGLPPKGGPSKYDQKSNKKKYGGGMPEEKRARDYKSKPALAFSSEAEHLKDLESLGYKTIRKK